MALRIINGDTPSEMAIESQKDLTLTVNPAAAKRMGVEIPSNIIDEDTEIIQ